MRPKVPPRSGARRRVSMLHERVVTPDPRAARAPPAAALSAPEPEEPVPFEVIPDDDEDLGAGFALA